MTLTANNKNTDAHRHLKEHVITIITRATTYNGHLLFVPEAFGVFHSQPQRLHKLKGKNGGNQQKQTNHKAQSTCTQAFEHTRIKNNHFSHTFSTPSTCTSTSSRSMSGLSAMLQNCSAAQCAIDTGRNVSWSVCVRRKVIRSRHTCTFLLLLCMYVYVWSVIISPYSFEHCSCV